VLIYHAALNEEMHPRERFSESFYIYASLPFWHNTHSHSEEHTTLIPKERGKSELGSIGENEKESIDSGPEKSIAGWI
jgi:hypothetical protein